MTTVRDYINSFKTADFVEGITNTPLQYGYINSQNDFNTKSTSQTAIIFDKDSTSISLLPQVNRGDRAHTQGKERSAETFALPLAYFKHADRLTGDDVQSWREVGATIETTLGKATAAKLEDMKRAWNQTQEYMKLQAKKGIFKTPDGKVMADMFAEFGIAQYELNLELGTNTTDIDKKLRQLKSYISKNVLNGGAIGGVECMLDVESFDKLISHPNIKNAYVQYVNSGKQVLRDDLSEYMKWGIMDHFEHRGVKFISYDATFNLPNGTQEVAFAANTGLATATGVKDLFRGYHGPSVKMSEANQPGQELFMRVYPDDRDEFVEFEMEAAPLYFCTRPASLVKLTTN
jgi:hypothetical protein